MTGSWAITPAPFGSIHTFTAPEHGWCVTSHVIELRSQLIVVDAQYTLSLAGEIVGYSNDLKKPISRLYITHYHPDHLLGATAFDAPAHALRVVADKIAAAGDRIAREEHEKVGNDIPDRAREIGVSRCEGGGNVDGGRIVC